MLRYRFGPWILDVSRRELTRDDRPVRLSRRAFEALQILLKSHPGAVSREDLYAALWPDTIVNLTNLNNVINEIRSAIADGDKKIVVTRHRFGYLIGVPVLEERLGQPWSRFALAIAERIIPLAEGENLVGRSSQSAVVLDLPSISRTHASIVVSGSRVEIEDLNSKNGTFVEHERLQQRRELHGGETICFGSVCGVFRTIAADSITMTDPAIKV